MIKLLPIDSFFNNRPQIKTLDHHILYKFGVCGPHSSRIMLVTWKHWENDKNNHIINLVITRNE